MYMVTLFNGVQDRLLFIPGAMDEAEYEKRKTEAESRFLNRTIVKGLKRRVASLWIEK